MSAWIHCAPTVPTTARKESATATARANLKCTTTRARTSLKDGGSVAACSEQAFGSDDYSCVDYEGGAYQLSGKELVFDVELDYVDCGCNAALCAHLARPSTPSPQLESLCTELL